MPAALCVQNVINSNIGPAASHELQYGNNNTDLSYKDHACDCIVMCFIEAKDYYYY